MLDINRGDVIYVDLGQHPKSSVQSGLRPCVVLNSCKSSPVAVVCPVTSNIKKKDLWFHIGLNSTQIKGHLNKDSIILMEQITTVDKNRILGKLGYILETSNVMSDIDDVIKKLLCKKEEEVI